MILQEYYPCGAAALLECVSRPRVPCIICTFSVNTTGIRVNFGPVAATQHNWEQHVPPSVMGYDHLQTCVEQHAAVLSHEQVPRVFQFVHRFSNPSYMLSPLSPSPQRKPQPQSCPSLHLPCLYTRSVEMYLTIYTTVHTQAGAVRTKCVI